MYQKQCFVLLCLSQVHLHMFNDTKSEQHWSIVHFSPFESIHATKINNQIEGCNKLSDFYSNQIKQKFVIAKFIARFSLFPTYILSLVCELIYLLHVHTCIDNLLFLYINDFFVQIFIVSI
jgi:hypothetical protein